MPEEKIFRPSITPIVMPGSYIEWNLDVKLHNMRDEVLNAIKVYATKKD